MVSAVWVKKTFTKQMPLGGDDFYGYLFWYRIFNLKGKKYEAFYASGNGGNKVFVFKDQPLVVVITSTAFGTAPAGINHDGALYPACSSYKEKLVLGQQQIRCTLP